MANMCWFSYLIFLICSFACRVTSEKQMTLANKHLRVGVVPLPPYLIITKNKKGQITYSGLYGDFLDYIKKARNSFIKVVIPHDRLWGNCYEKDNCTGMIGLVTRNDVDFSLGINKHNMYVLVRVATCYTLQFQGHFYKLKIGPVLWISHGQLVMDFML